MEFRLLGPVHAIVAGRPVSLGVRQQRLVLAVLALEVNRLVAVERLVDLTWPGDPPGSARRVIHSQISRLRSTLTLAGAGEHSVEVRREGSGYVLSCDPGRIDAHRFTELLALARDSDDDERVRRLDEALGLWRGPALLDAASQEIRGQLCGQLDEARLTAIEDRLDTRLRLGHLRSVVDEATPLCAEHPQRHRFVGVLMRALHAAGRSADALAAYQQARHRLADDVGLDPPAELQQLHLEILRDNSEPVSLSPALPSPAQLPADTPTFTGRAAELDRLLAAWPGTAPATVVICALDGMAGAGKTALAVHAAHRLASQFPDGQLFLDFHGHTQDVAPVEPTDALDRLLRALGVAGEQVPAHVDDRAALLRTVLSGRRVLLVLDNVATEAQVRPLLPGTAGCLVLITSRHRLTGLDDAHPVPVGLLPHAEAVALFTDVAGRDRLAGTAPGLVADIVELCGRLPLAIRIAAARLHAHPTWTAAHLAERLRDQQQRLEELHAGQRSVTTALNLSYHHLAPAEQRAYRLLGLHPGPDIDIYATAALTDTSPAEAGRLLDSLLGGHLLSEPAPGAYTFHDLTRAHAARTCHDHEPDADRRAALTRLLDHYAGTAVHAVGVAFPYQADYQAYLTSPGTSTHTFTEPAQAAAWLDGAMPNLLSVATYAAQHGWPAHTVGFAVTLHHQLHTIRANGTCTRLLHTHALDAARETGDRLAQVYILNGLGDVDDRRGSHEQAAETYRAALTIARDIGDRRGEHRALRNLGHVHRFAGRYEAAIEHFEQALAIVRDLGDLGGEMFVVYGLGTVHRARGDHDLAVECDQQALAIARTIGHRDGELQALYGLGYTYRLRGHYDLALDSYRQALATAHEIGNRGGELFVLHGIGNVHYLHDDHGRAIECYQQALAIAQEVHDRNGEFETRHDLGRTHLAMGEPTTALTYHRQALDLARELGQPADEARAHHGLAAAHDALGQADQARYHWQRSLAVLTELNISETDEIKVTDLKAKLATTSWTSIS